MTERVITSACELRLGDWQNVLADVEQVDALIVDPPYSQRTEDGFRSGSLKYGKGEITSGLGYAPITEEWAHAFVASWMPRTRSWMVVCCDHISARWFEDAMKAAGRYTFPPIPIVKIGAAPRLSNDGPASQCEWMMVSRPREKRFLSWGSLRGWYEMQTVRAGHGSVGISGAKSVDFMRAIVRDYTRPGDLICDPCAGGATTLVAAAHEGRRAIGAERDEAHFEIARKRLEKPITPPLFISGAQEAEQSSLWGEE